MNEELVSLQGYDFDPSKAIDDCFYFCDKLFAYHGVKEREFGNVHQEILNRIIGSRWSLTIIPISHLKTTLVTKGYTLWRMWRESNYWVAIVSSATKQAKTPLMEMRYYLENTPWLKHLVPEKNESLWNQTNLVMTNRNKITLEAFNSTARGIQPDEIIYDDILRDEEGITDMPMDKIIDTFFGTFFGRGLTRTCKHHVVGTPQSDNDLYSEIEDKAKMLGDKYKDDPSLKWSIVRYGAVVFDDDGNWKKPLWPERYTLKELELMRDLMGQYRFNRELLCMPSVQGSSFFPNILMATDDNLSFSYKTSGNVYVGFDYATSTSPTGDYNAAIVIDELEGVYRKRLQVDGIEKDFTVVNPIIIKKIYHFKGDDRQLAVGREIYNTFKPIRFICDESNVGVKFIKELRSEGYSVQSQDFERSRRRDLLINARMFLEVDPDAKNLAPRLIIPTSQEDDTFAKTKILIKQLNSFQEGKTRTNRDTIESTGKHDDMAIALALALKPIIYKRGMNAPIVLSAEKLNVHKKQEKFDKDSDGKYLGTPGEQAPQGRFRVKTW